MSSDPAANTLYERCMPRSGAGLWLKVEPMSPNGYRGRRYFYYVPHHEDYAFQWRLEGPRRAESSKE